MYVQARIPRGSDNQTTPTTQAVKPAAGMAREKIAAFKQKLSTGLLDGADEALAPKGPASQLRLT
jgi:hypothetical protein